MDFIGKIFVLDGRDTLAQSGYFIYAMQSIYAHPNGSGIDRTVQEFHLGKCNAHTTMKLALLVQKRVIKYIKGDVQTRKKEEHSLTRVSEEKCIIWLGGVKIL